MTPVIDWVAVLPELAVTLTIVVAVVVDLFLGDSSKRWVTVASFVGVAAGLVAAVALHVDRRTATMLDASYVVDEFSLVAKAVLLASTALVLLFGAAGTWRGEYCVMVLSALLGAVLLVSARDLLTFFVAFELLAIPGYLLVGWQKRSVSGHEAALKYYLLGVLATGVLLYGLSLLFGLSGSLRFVDIAARLPIDGASEPLVAIAVFFVIVGLAFKVSAVPFHFWAPDAYSGGPIAVASFLSVISKAAGLFGLITLLAIALPAVSSVWAPLLWAISALSMTWGNLAALRQTDMVRLLAYSSISQAGYLLIPIAVVGEYGGEIGEAIPAVVTYLVIYSVMNLGAFAVAAAVSRQTGSTATGAFRGLFERSPAQAVAMTVFLLSLAGIPPLGGWFAKFVIFRAGIEAGSAEAVALVAVAAVNTAIGLVYYAVVVRQMWLEKLTPDSGTVDETRSTVPPTLVAAIGVTALAVLLFGVFPGLVTSVGEVSSLRL